MMKKTWQEHDLEGKGLQSINLNYAARKKETKKAYLLACVFPLGLHQFYLGQTKKGWTYVILTALLLATANVSVFISALIGFAEIMLLTRDIVQIENSVAEFNKKLKMSLSLQHDTGIPENFTGKYSDEKNQSSTQQKILSFSEQEALLRELSSRKTDQ